MLNEREKLLQAVRYIIDDCKIREAPEVGIVCGSGLGKLADLLESPKSIPYASIPHFVASTVAGHSGELVFSEKEGIKLVCMRGRVHMYEGYNVVDCIRPIRAMALLGVKILVVTNAAGNVNKCFEPGDFMIIKDHISFPALSGENPLRGAHDKLLGKRFVTMSNAYDRQTLNILESVGQKMNFKLRKGVYAMVSGPTYETIAEANLLKMLGADAVGMSTVHEVIVAHQMGVKCLGISLLTNNVSTDYEQVEEEIVEHEQVVDMGAQRADDFVKIIVGFLAASKSLLKSIESKHIQRQSQLKHQTTNGNSNSNSKLNKLTNGIKSTINGTSSNLDLLSELKQQLI